MSAVLAADVTVSLEGANFTYAVIVALIALVALVVAAVLVRCVLANSQGTENMQEIAGAVQEGASAYLTRQFKTLSIFAVIVFFVLFLLPAETNSERIGRSIFFVVGAVFSGVTGYVGMWLAVRANVRVYDQVHLVDATDTVDAMALALISSLAHESAVEPAGTGTVVQMSWPTGIAE